MKQRLFLSLAILLVTTIGFAQVGIGTTNPDPSSILDVTSTTKGMLPPRMTEAQRDVISNPLTGLLVYNIDTQCLEMNIGTTTSPNWQCTISALFTDSDGDGVPDAIDSSPSDCSMPNANGCDDTDGDGTPDATDSDPNNCYIPNPSGCLDDDGDAIPNASDLAPNDCSVPNANGCDDADNDGIPDGTDPAPNDCADPLPYGCGANPEVSVTVSDPGTYAGTYVKNNAFDTTNTVTFIVTNNSLSAVGPIDFNTATAINTTASTAFASATATTSNSVDYSAVSINSGQSYALVYTISGTPDAIGDLVIDFSSVAGLTASATQAVLNGQATYTLPYVEYFFSEAGNTGVLSNTFTFEVPYTDGLGDYDAYDSGYITMTDNNGNPQDIKITRDAATFSTTGTIIYTVTTQSGSAIFVPEQVSPETQIFATFAGITVNGITIGDIQFEANATPTTHVAYLLTGNSDATDALNKNDGVWSNLTKELYEVDTNGNNGARFMNDSSEEVYISIPNLPTYTEWTIAFSFDPKSTGYSSMPIYFADSNTFMYFYGNDIYLRLNGSNYYINNNLYDNSNRHEYAWTSDGTSVRLYVDNVLKQTIAKSGVFLSGDLRIGGAYSSTYNTNSVMTYVDVWSEVLTDTELVDLLNQR